MRHSGTARGAEKRQGKNISQRSCQRRISADMQTGAINARSAVLTHQRGSFWRNRDYPRRRTAERDGERAAVARNLPPHGPLHKERSRGRPRICIIGESDGGHESAGADFSAWRIGPRDSPARSAAVNSGARRCTLPPQPRRRADFAGGRWLAPDFINLVRRAGYPGAPFVAAECWEHDALL